MKGVSMFFSIKPCNILQKLSPYAATAALALALKYQYSRAAVDDLLWIMGPTAGLVSRLTGLAFVHDPSWGFVNHGLGIAIAPACSGVNFLIIGFCMAAFSFTHTFEKMTEKFVWIGASLASAYLLTLGVNTLRIGLSILTLSHDIHLGWLTAERLHRMEGIGVYFFCLCVYYRWLYHFMYAQPRQKGGPGWQDFRDGWPLFWYLAMAIGVPLFTGNFQDHPLRFLEHGLTVLLVCSIMVIIFIGLGKVNRPKQGEVFQSKRDGKKNV